MPRDAGGPAHAPAVPSGTASSPATALPCWDLLCQVVDNYGDAGVLWRLARRLGADGQRRVRLWIDDLATLAALEPEARWDSTVAGVEIRRWQPDLDTAALPDVLITGFDARPPASLRQRMKPGHPLWITVDHLSAETWVEGFHGSPSPKSDGVVEHYFYPGFTAATGGLLLEPGVLAARDAARDSSRDTAAGAHGHGSDQTPASALLFCYHPSPVLTLARVMAASARHPLSRQTTEAAHAVPERWLIRLPRAGLATRDRAAPACRPPGTGTVGREPAGPGRSDPTGDADTRPGSSVRLEAVPFLSQCRFDDSLRASTLNLVRGEDSQVRAIWAARPFLWQAWRQDETTRSAKVEAFLARQADWLHPADQAALARLTRWWNGLIPAEVTAPDRTALAMALSQVMGHQRRIVDGLSRWGDALARHELAAALIRFAGERAGRPL